MQHPANEEVAPEPVDFYGQIGMLQRGDYTGREHLQEGIKIVSRALTNPDGRDRNLHEQLLVHYRRDSFTCRLTWGLLLDFASMLDGELRRPANLAAHTKAALDHDSSMVEGTRAAFFLLAEAISSVA